MFKKGVVIIVVLTLSLLVHPKSSNLLTKYVVTPAMSSASRVSPGLTWLLFTYSPG